ncbi:MAG: GxxExxY protein [Candidatus Zambryskibacteria bacterium CG10_big_fil_rev_8_21_14_0_10_42_12]|uniref:GxxExxY protein n=1 Tax=Candidatus Zambryskibacteria bacterium CG10_big_fil_rev_8_21_14_0_10_42_12 TaxID=1975115 RepID=A0A2H0QWJ5_9BACT|nr:MAG: GxxExxY protein [Candidatus Zambryskibacteria bacterium CG10_big_fil_rev_8_21_14_0_10_42_12]
MTTNRNVSKEMEKVIYPQLSYSLTGILFKVHNELGQYAREKQYGDLLESYLKEACISYKRELNLGDSGNILDFVIDNKIILELKAVRVITGESFRQVQNYLQQSHLKLGILVNFRAKYLKPARVLRIDGLHHL